MRRPRRIPGKKVTKPGRKMPTKPGTDVLVFTNGDQLTGTLEKGEGECITFQSDMTGEITIPLAKIKELRTGGELRAAAQRYEDADGKCADRDPLL